MSKPKPYTMQVIDAVGASDLPQDLRHLLVTMAYLANSKTGQGLSGQDTIGRFMGCSGREVRRKLDRLENMPGAPVRVGRRLRFRKDGARTSDEYRLILGHRTPTSAGDADTTGRPRPEAAADLPTSPPDVKHTTTGRETSSPPDAHVRGSSQGILFDGPRSSFVAPESATGTPPNPPKKGNAKKGKRKPKGETKAKKRPEPERTEEQKAAFNRTKDCYFEAFTAKRRAKPVFGKAEGKSIYVLLEKFEFNADKACAAIATAYQSFRAGSVTILQIAKDPLGFEPVQIMRGRGAAPPQPGSDFDFKKFEAKDAQA